MSGAGPYRYDPSAFREVFERHFTYLAGVHLNSHRYASRPALHDPATAACVRAERHVMVALDGGCRLPVGALATPQADGALHLLGGVALDDGTLNIAALDGRLEDAEALAEQLARRLRSPGAGEQRRVVYA